MIVVHARDVNGDSVGEQARFRGPFAVWRAQRWIDKQLPPIYFPGRPPMWTYTIETA